MSLWELLGVRGSCEGDVYGQLAGWTYTQVSRNGEFNSDQQRRERVVEKHRSKYVNQIIMDEGCTKFVDMKRIASIGKNGKVHQTSLEIEDLR